MTTWSGWSPNSQRDAAKSSRTTPTNSVLHPTTVERSCAQRVTFPAMWAADRWRLTSESTSIFSWETTRERNVLKGRLIEIYNILSIFFLVSRFRFWMQLTGKKLFEISAVFRTLFWKENFTREKIINLELKISFSPIELCGKWNKICAITILELTNLKKLRNRVSNLRRHLESVILAPIDAISKCECNVLLLQLETIVYSIWTE